VAKLIFSRRPPLSAFHERRIMAAMEKSRSFKCGDIVRLKSGGPDMTVSERSPLDDIIDTPEKDWIPCQWFNRANTLQNKAFPPESLVHVEHPNRQSKPPTL
jgi:uncharacterized protein YodC (DUF2158 family)